MDVQKTDTRTLYQSLKAAIVSQELSAQGVELLSPDQVRMAIGQDATGSSITLIRNLQRKAVVEMRRDELQSAADWMLSLILSTYPNAEVGITRGRVVQVWLDGMPEVIE